MRETEAHRKIADDLQAKVKTLHSSIWEKRADWPLVKLWLDQFDSHDEVDKDEQIQALFLLSNFMYFGTNEIRALLRSLFRDQFRPRVARTVREAHAGSRDPAIVGPGILEHLQKTRFVALGNPSESSAMLLYYFRQENVLPKDLFISASEVFELKTSGQSVVANVRNPDILHYVFIDDLCGSGQQGIDYSKDIVTPLKAMNSKVQTYYYSLFGLADGLSRIRKEAAFDTVCSVVELDESFKAFSTSSRVFARTEAPYDKGFAETTCLKYGQVLWPDHPLGFSDGQLLIGFSHNTPDNTLPIFSFDEQSGANWTPVFKRYPKVEW